MRHLRQACHHAADERVPVDALEFGVQTIFSAMQLFRSGR